YEEATKLGCTLVVSYHPPIFQPLKAIEYGSPVERSVRRGIAIYSMHTALDIADGGTNDVLADAIGMRERTPLRVIKGSAGECKLVTFVPEEHVGAVSEALFAAGAGHVGEYAKCSFRMKGTGTFQGGANTNPSVGKRETFEQVSEIRVEVVVPLTNLSDV